MSAGFCRSLFLALAVAGCASAGGGHASTSRADAGVVVRLRVINNATCDVRLQVSQHGAWQKTVDIPSLVTKEATVIVKGLEDPLEYRVDGAACRFSPYKIPVATSANATDVDVIVSDRPIEAATRVRVRPPLGF